MCEGMRIRCRAITRCKDVYKSELEGEKSYYSAHDTQMITLRVVSLVCLFVCLFLSTS